MTKYMSVQLPKDVLTALDRWMAEHPEQGYSSRADAIKDAVRRLMREQ